MSDMFFKLGPDADSTITLYPEWDYENGLKKIEKNHRLQNADMYVYKTGEYEEINIKCKFFPLSDAAIVNSWWQSNAELVFYKREKDFRDWSFTDSAEGWAAVNQASLSVNSGYAILEQNSIATDAGSIQYSDISFQGSEYYIFTVKLKRTVPLTWYGYLHYATSGANSHDTGNSYYLSINEPIGIDSDYVIATWDMRSLTVGGNDWVNSEITDLHLYFTTDESGTHEIDYIDIGYKYSSVSSVMIRNSKKPFSKYQEPYADYMQGTIKLEGY